MTIQLYAQPYDISAEGFFFSSAGDYRRKAAKLRNAHGEPVEEFEIQFIDGEQIDAELARAIDLSQASFAFFLERAAEWNEQQKTAVIIAVPECGMHFDLETDDPDDLDIDIYRLDSLRDLAIEFVEEGLFGEIPERLQFYLDYDAIARDLAMDYSEAVIAGERLIYRCG